MDIEAIDLKSGIVRIRNDENMTVGTGFLVSDEGVIVTCAHVVQDAGAGPDDRVNIVFHTNSYEYQAKVESAYWHEHEDIAILKLIGHVPEGAQSLWLGRTTNSEGLSFKTFGFPKASGEGGFWAKGDIQGETTTSLGIRVLQVRSQEITPGYSGAPVWDISTQRVVGMVVAIAREDDYGRLGETAFITPSELLWQCGPASVFESPYLKNLITRLEKSRGVSEYVELPIQSIEIHDQERNIPKSEPHAVKDWGLDEDFATLEKNLIDQSLSAPKAIQVLKPGKVFDHIEQAVSEYSRFVLLGEPGAGKTTTLRYLALKTAYKHLEHPNVEPLPLLLFLPAWDDKLTIDEFIDSNWPIVTDPKRMITERKVILFLDGLNEMGMAGIEKVKQLRRWLRTENAPHRIVISCRQKEYQKNLDLTLPVVILGEIDEQHIRQFASLYLGNEAPLFLNKIFPSEQVTHAKIKHLYKIARNPFMIMALMLIHKDSPESELPRNHGILFRQLAKTLWEKERRRTHAEWKPYEEVESIFSHLAYVMIKRNKSINVPEKYALKYLKEESFLEAGVQANLLERQGQQVRFFHQSMQAYFAAVSMNPQDITKKVKRPQVRRELSSELLSAFRIPQKWDQTIIALSGIYSDPDIVVNTVLKKDPYLAAMCIASGISVSEKLYQDTILRVLKATELRFKDYQSASNALQYAQLYLEIQQAKTIVAQNILLELEDKIYLYLQDIMRDRQQSSWVRNSAIQIIKKVADVDAIPYLLDVLTDVQGEYESIAHSLSKIGIAVSPIMGELSIRGLRNIKSLQGLFVNLLIDTGITTKAAFSILRQLPNIRQSAAIALGQIGDNRAVPGLITALNDDNPDVCKAVAEALSTIGGSEAMNGLVKILHEENNKNRGAVALALATIGDDRIIPDLITLLQDTNADIRNAVAQALGKFKTSEALTALTNYLDNTKDHEWTIRDQLSQFGEKMTHLNWREQAETLGSKAQDLKNINWREQAETLRDKAKDVKNVNIRGTALKAVGLIKEGKIANPIQALRSKDSEVRKSALQSLGEIGDSSAIPYFVEALKDNNSEVQELAAQMLGNFRDYRVVPNLLEALHDKESRIRQASAESLGKIGDRTALPDLLGALHDKDEDVRDAAAYALGCINDPATMQKLIEILQSKKSPISAVAVKALGWSRDPAYRQVLVDVLQASDVDLRIAAVQALGKIGDSQSIPDLVKLLKDKKRDVRCIAAQVLGEIGDVAAVNGLVKALKDGNPYVRGLAVEALGIIKDPGIIPDIIKLLSDKAKTTLSSSYKPLKDRVYSKTTSTVKTLVLGLRLKDGTIVRVCDIAALALRHIGTAEALTAVEDWESKHGKLKKRFAELIKRE